MVELKDIMKLPPKERIMKLKELEEQKKREIEEAKKLMVESEIESEEEERIKDLREIASEPVSMKGSSLEDEVINVKTEPPLESFGDYISQLSHRPANILYQEMQSIVGEGGLSEDQIRNLSTIQYALEEKKKDIERGEYFTNEMVMRTIDSTRKILEEIMGAYKR